MLVHSKKAFLLSLAWSGTEYTWELIWKKSLVICIESYEGALYSHTGRVDRGWSPFWLTSLIYAEKFEFENTAIMEDKQCKQMERFSVMTKGSDYFLS